MRGSNQQMRKIRPQQERKATNTKYGKGKYMKGSTRTQKKCKNGDFSRHYNNK